MKSGPDFAAAFLVFAAMGLAFIVVGLIALTNPRGVGRRWTEWLYVHAPNKVEASDAPYAKALVRYRVFSVLMIAFGVACIYSSVTDIFV